MSLAVRGMVVAVVVLTTCLQATSAPGSNPGRTPAARAGGAVPGTPLSTSVDDTLWVNAHSTSRCTGAPHRGGEATGGPDGFETWCFEAGPGDSTSDGRPGGYTFTSFDRRRLRDDNDSLYWHADTLQAIAGKSMWCGGWNERSGSWQSTGGGYGDDWQQIMQLTLAGPFDATRGCSLQFKTRYALECNYDYAYLEYYSFRRSQWRVIDRFNGKSGCTVLSGTKTCMPDWNNYRSAVLCPPLPYGGAVNYPGPFTGGASRDFPAYPYVAGNSWVLIRGDSISSTPGAIPELRFRWRVGTDSYYSTQDGQVDVHGFWLDDVKVRVGGYTHSESFDAVAGGGLPASPYSFPHLDPIYDGWAIRYDLDPPFEGMVFPGPGDAGAPFMCQVNASWQWSLTPDGALIPPPQYGTELPGYQVILASPSVPLDYADEEGGPFTNAGVVVQWDLYESTDAGTEDIHRERMRLHFASGIGAWMGAGVWGPWKPIEALYVEGSIYGFDANWNLTSQIVGSGADSVQFGWASFDIARPGDAAWDPTLPPHVGTQEVVDNVSIGIVDAGAPEVYANYRASRFQDTFNLHSCLHTANVANGDLGYGTYLLHDGSESLDIDITDADGLTPGNVRLHYSFDAFATEAAGSPIAMHLSRPNPIHPEMGGEWRTTICDTPWTPGTEVSYYIEIEDDPGHVAVWPSSAGPLASPRDFPHVDILPTPGAKILLVDDNDHSAPLYHPCRLDTTTLETGTFYADILRDLGYGYMEAGGFDRYDVEAAQSNQRITEPWGFWTADPATPESGSRAYDVVIWTTGAWLSWYTIQDTTQTFLKQFVFHGGRALITGDLIGENLSNPWVSQDPDFYGNLLGAEFAGTHGYGFTSPDRFPTVPASPAGTFLAPGDSLHIYAGCASPREMDRIRMKAASLPAWSHPAPYLVYDDTSAPFDSLAGILNWVTATEDTGVVAYLPFSLDAVVDQHRVTCDPPWSPFGDVGPGTFQGQAELLADVLGIFGASPRTSVATPSDERFTDALRVPSPNPVHDATGIAFTISAAARVTLAIFDVEGRRVATLVDRDMEAGPHSAHWSGRNGAGEPVAPGIYFARLETPRFSATEKVLLVR